MKKKFLAMTMMLTLICSVTACGTAGNNSGSGTDGTVSIETGSDNIDSDAEGAIDNNADNTEADNNGEDTDGAAAGVNAGDGDGAGVADSTGNSTDTVEEEKTPYEQMIEKSLMAPGNNYRVKKVLEKARSGETVNMAILGGSITEGAGASVNTKGYAYQFAEAFKETYCSGDNLNFVNAGLSGTPSSLGVMRYEKDVLGLLGTKPDFLVIEFAVNDWQEATKGRALESLIYRALTDNEDCAVVLLFSVSQGKWNLQNDMKPTGNYYALPMVSVLDAVTSNPELKDSDFFSDEYHPKTYGHTVMSDCMMYLLETIDKADENVPFEIPENAKKGREFADMTLITGSANGVTVDKGSFTATDSAIQNMFFTKEGCFPQNYMKDGGSNNPLKVTLTCKTMLLDYKTANDGSYGTAEVYVDGVLVATIEGNSAGGWNNNNVILVIDEKEAAQHTVEVKMAAGSESKKFTVLALSYS